MGKKSLVQLMKIIKDYEMLSGQLMGPAKSSFFFSSKFPTPKKLEVLWITGFMEGKWPCNYLGVPLHVGRITIQLFDPLLMKIFFEKNDRLKK